MDDTHEVEAYSVAIHNQSDALLKKQRLTIRSLDHSLKLLLLHYRALCEQLCA